MKQTLIALVRTSIELGYLQEDWHKNKDDVVQTAKDYLALSGNCVRIGDEYYHEKLDDEHFVYDSINKGYLLHEDSIYVYEGVDRYFYTDSENSDDYYLYKNDYYTYEGLRANNLVFTQEETVMSIDDAYYWESDEAYHDEPEEDDEDELWDYHDGPCPPDYRKDKDEPGIGFEIEKGGNPDFCGYYDKNDLFGSTGCVMEKDGSVDWELKTPIYPLFSDSIENKWLPQISAAINAENHEDAGGHINLSIPPKEGKKVFDHCRPYFPLFMAMYPTRLEGTYAKGKTEILLKNDYDDDHQAIRIWDSRIEMRFPAKVFNMNALLFRLSFCRLMVNREYTNIPSVILAAFDTQTELGKLVMQEYENRRTVLLDRVIKISKKYFGTDLLREKNIEILFANLKNKKICA